MDSLAFKFLVLKELIEGNMGCIRYELFIQAVHAFGIRPMLAQPFHFSIFLLWVVVCTVEALSSRPMTAFGFILFDFILAVFFAGFAGADAVETFATRRVITLRIGLRVSES